MTSTRNYSYSVAFVMAVTGVLFAGCTTVTTQSFNSNKSSNVESAQIAVGADFGQFDRLTAEDMGIFFPDGAAPSIEDQRRTRQIFRSVFLNELKNYQIVDGAGPTTLLVKPTLIDFRKSSGGDAMLVRSELRDLASAGSMIFLMELADSETGEVLARATDSASVPSFGDGDKSSTDWDAVELAAEKWAKLFRQFLDENLNK
jgi:hypothetical protein